MVATDSVEAGEGTEAEELHEEDRKNDFLETARHREDAAAEVIDRLRRQIARRSEADGNRDQNADDGRGDGHPQALVDTLGNGVPAGHEIRREESAKKRLGARQALGHTRPVDVERAEGNGEVEGDAEAESAAQESGRANVCTPVTNEHLVCRLLLETKK